ncbi:hypothetical protein [Nonomuraea sp. NPDC049504]|uniref:hypothetical protein n=1 Tax=Nonomuraea sp. NPDC049504 TaxID=3154729 RepID=UPI00341AA9F5
MSSREPDEDYEDYEEYEAIEAELRALGDLLDTPAPPPADVAAAVRTRLTSTPAPETPAPETPAPETPVGETPSDASEPGGTREARERLDQPHVPQRRRRRVARWKVVTAVVVAVAALVAATPQGRAAVVRILRFAGIELRVGDTTPPPVTTTAPLPGERTVAPTEVPRMARTPAALGPPQRTTVSDGGRVVSMFWPDGIRLDQFDGTLDPYLFKKLGPPYPDFTEVGGRTAWWIKGDHPLGHIRRQDGTEVPLRQAGPTLIWQHGTLNLRLEGLKSKEEAVRVAESLG